MADKKASAGESVNGEIVIGDCAHISLLLALDFGRARCYGG